MKYTKRNYKKNARSTSNYVTKKEVKTLIKSDIETKQLLVGLSPFTVTNAGSIIALSAILNNVGADGRIGEQVNLSEFSFNFDCIASQSALGGWLAGDAYNNIRCIIFRWYADSGITAPTVSDVLYTASPSYTYMAPYNPTRIEANLVHICYDKTFILENTPYWNGTTTLFASGQSSIHNVMNKKIYGKKLGRKKLNFNSSAVTGTGHLYMLLVSDSGSAPHPYAQFAGTLKYTDA